MVAAMNSVLEMPMDQEWTHEQLPTPLAPAPRQQQQQQQVSACDQCHRRKLRCSRKKPACGRCHFSGLQCTYSLCRPAGRPRRSLSGRTDSPAASDHSPIPASDRLADAVSFADAPAVPFPRQYSFPDPLVDMSGFPSPMLALSLPEPLPSYQDVYNTSNSLCDRPTGIAPVPGVATHAHGALDTSSLSRLQRQADYSFPPEDKCAEPASGREDPAAHTASSGSSAASEATVCRCTQTLLRSASDLEAAAAAAADPAAATPGMPVLEIANAGFEALVMCKERHDGLQHLMLLAVICQLEKYMGAGGGGGGGARGQQDGGGGAERSPAPGRRSSVPGSRNSLPPTPYTQGPASPLPLPASFEWHYTSSDGRVGGNPQPEVLASLPRELILRSYLLLAALSSEVLTRKAHLSCLPELPLELHRTRVDRLKAMFRARLGLSV